MADKDPKKKNQNLFFMSYKRRMAYGFFRSVRKIIGLGLACLFIFFLLSGAINQVKTGETIIDYAIDIGHNIGNFFESLFTKDSPLKVTEDGVYFKDANVPENSALPEVK